MSEEIFVTRSFLPPLEEYIEEIRPLWDSHRLTNMGDKHRRLERELAAWLKAPMVTLFTNGHMALELAIQALGLSGEVITTPFTFVSTTHAIVRNGLRPVFCDINPRDYTLDAERLESLITERTSAILPVHVYGNLCDVQAIEKLAQKYKLKVLYDAAHAFGVEKDGVGAGAFGDASMFSFHATKVYHTIEGGAVAYADEELGRKLYNLKNFGIRGEEFVEAVGANAKMNEFAAAMGLCNLRHVDSEMEKRGAVCGWYNAHLDGVPGLRLPPGQPGVKTNHAYYPVLFNAARFGQNRDAIYARLRQNGIFPRKYFYPLTSAMACYRERYGAAADTPVALEISRQVLTLPLYAELTEADVERICRVILED